MNLNNYSGIHIKSDPQKEMSPEDYAIFKDAVDRGAIKYTPYDDRKAIKQIEQLFNAYINIPDDALNTALEKAGKPFKDDLFDSVLEQSIALAAADPQAKRILYKAIQSNPELKSEFDTRAKQENWEPEMENDWYESKAAKKDANQVIDDDEYEFEWHEPTKEDLEAIQDNLDTNDDGKITIDELNDARDKSAEHAIAESNRVEEEYPDDDKSDITWSNITNVLKNRRF
jgi:hypothetical protein